jgi:hypothetical protein
MRRTLLIALAAVPAHQPGDRGPVQPLAPRPGHLHLWLWYPNPAGLYNATNPWTRPFNRS